MGQWGVNKSSSSGTSRQSTSKPLESVATNQHFFYFNNFA
tara:strand:- start:149 stop:268 length:120 start_codon:yes stop_codon:yes gene_type:complete